MKNILAFTLVIFTTTLCLGQRIQESINLNEIFSRKYQHKLISNGDNFPNFNVRKDKLDLFLIALHKDVPIKEIQEKIKFSNKKMESIIHLLESRGWLHSIDGKYKPKVFIATQEDGDALYEYSEPISNKIAVKIKENLSGINERFNQTEISKKQSFEEWSFLILSNVLLDNWQINNVENQFLGKYSRPTRHGKNYYASILENNTDRESFGIYGNQYGQVSVYGNNRRKADLSSTEYFVSKNDDEIFASMADSFLPGLIEVLIEFKPYCNEVYERTGYSNEITFEEFFIWWYHFIYTQTTDIMAERKLLKIPGNGNFVYGIEK